MKKKAKAKGKMKKKPPVSKALFGSKMPPKGGIKRMAAY